MKVLFGPDLNFHSLLPELGKREPCCLKLCTHIEVKSEGPIRPRAEFQRNRKKRTVFQDCLQISREQMKVLETWSLSLSQGLEKWEPCCFKNVHRHFQVRQQNTFSIGFSVDDICGTTQISRFSRNLSNICPICAIRSVEVNSVRWIV